MRHCPACATLHGDAVAVCPADGEPLGPPDALLGAELDGKYRIEGLLGRGGMGSVYRARHVALDRTVAIKVLPGDFSTDPDRVERFRHEALAVARLKHPHVVTVYDYNVTSAFGAYLVMEFVGGRPLSGAIRRRGRIPAAAAIDLARQICAGVQAAHDAGVIHRDLKPANVVLEIAPGGAVLAKVLDFGIAKVSGFDDVRAAGAAADPEATIAGAIGTPLYMSPEQCTGDEADERSDVYAIGCLLYEMLTGRPPFVSDQAHVLLYRHSLVEPQPPGASGVLLHPDVDAAVLRALEKRPENRYQSPAAFAVALASVRALVEPDASFPPVLTASTGVLASRELAGEAVAARALETRASVANNLPHETTSFVGRADDIAAVAELLAGHRIVTLFGPGGIGKTRLARQVAARVMADHADGVWFADLSLAADGEQVAAVVAAAAGAAELPGRSPAASLTAHFAARRSLVVLDNCEHLTDACGEFAAMLVAACPGVAVLVTSQAIIGLPGETVFRVPPLGLPASKRASDAADAEAVRLFVDRARQQNASFSLSDENVATVSRICERLDGLPLAIELAAARMRVLSAAQILERLDDRFRLLTGGARRGGARQRTLRATLDWSFGLLGTDEQTLFARLAVFAGSWTLEAAEAVCSGGTLDAWAILDMTTVLVDRSLVVAVPAGPDIRYRMLESIRQYALELFEKLPDAPALRDLHRAYVVDMAQREEQELTGLRMERSFRRLEAELENIRAALEWGASAPDPGAAILELACPIYRFMSCRGYLAEAHAWLTRGLAEAREAPDVLRAHAMSHVGAIEVIFGNYAKARAMQSEALDLLRRAGDERGVAFSLNSLGSAAYYLGEYDEALRYYEECVVVFRTVGDDANLANVLNNLGMIVRIRGDRERAEAIYEEALGISRRLDYRVATARSLMSLGVLRAEARDPRGAVGLLEEAVELFDLSGERRMTASARNSLGDALRMAGDRERAAAHLRAAIETHFDVGDTPNVVYSLASFANLASDAGAHARALRLAGAYEALSARFGFEMSPFEREDFAVHVARAREAEGAAGASAEAEGRTLSLDAAVALALGA